MAPTKTFVLSIIYVLAYSLRGVAFPHEAITISGNYITLAGAESGFGTMGNYTLGAVQWKGQMEPNGPDMQITGRSLEQIFSYLEENAPHAIKPKNMDTERVNRLGTRQIESNQYPYPHYTLCNRPPPMNRMFNYGRAFGAAHEYLDRLNGQCRADQPHGCGRISCSWNSGVYFCNDVDHGQWIYCNEITRYLDEIKNVCSYVADPAAVGDDGGHPDRQMSDFNGQRFRTDTGYNIGVWGTPPNESC